MSIPEEIEFEAALAELERIVETLERGGPDLKGALAGYGRGVALLGHCQAILDGAERSVALLAGVDEAGRPVTTPFDAAATGATPPPAPVAAVTIEAVTATVAVDPAPPVARQARPTPATTPPASSIPEAPF